MGKYERLINAYRYLIMAGTMLLTLLQIPIEQYAVCILILLILVFNMQIRVIVNKYNFILFSILIDLVILFYLQKHFTELVCIYILVTLVDAILRLKTERYYFLCLLSLFFGYCLYQFKQEDVSLILALLYCSVLLLLLHLSKELSSKLQVENLYDQFRRNTYELEAARARLVDYSKQVEKVTKLEERNRISRELHDSIGHHLTGVLMQVDAALQVMAVNQEKGMQLLEAAYKNINECIESVRYIVKQLRPSEYQTHKSSIKELINNFMQNTEVRVALTTSGIPYDLFPSVETVLFRNIQEALTNAVKHGKASEITVHFNYKLETIEVEVSDNGLGCSQIKKGFGLSGIEERLDVIGGTIAYKLDQGFKMIMTIPRREMK